MKYLLTSAATVAVLLSVAACDRRNETEPAPVPAEPAVDRSVLPEGVPFQFADAATPEGFAQRMAMSDLFEVAASRHAQDRSGAEPVRDFAREMVTAHTATTNELKALLQQETLTPSLPTALDVQHQRRLNDLMAAAPTDFDRVYLDQQTRAHEAALDTLEGHAERGTNPPLKAWAARTAVTVRQHLERARSLDRGGGDGTETPELILAPTGAPADR